MQQLDVFVELTRLTMIHPMILFMTVIHDMIEYLQSLPKLLILLNLPLPFPPPIHLSVDLSHTALNFEYIVVNELLPEALEHLKSKQLNNKTQS